MSIRHYNPRRNRRRGISPQSKNLLTLLLVITILLQISYPLLDGASLRIVTITTVLVAALTMVIHGHLSYGAKYTAIYVPVSFLFGLGIESLGLHTGWPFGVYTYSSTLGPQLFGVPFVVPFAWMMMIHPALIAARRLTKKWVFLYGGALMAAWDIFLDPLMVGAGRWTWVVTGSHLPFAPDVPLSNTFGWLLAGITIVGILNVILPRERRKNSASLATVDVWLLWTLFSGFIGNLFFFDRPGLAFFGTFIFGSLLTPYLFSSWLSSKD